MLLQRLGIALYGVLSLIRTGPRSVIVVIIMDQIKVPFPDAIPTGGGVMPIKTVTHYIVYFTRN